MGNNAKKHHFIPQCYLKGFQYGHSKTPKIVVYNKHTMKEYIAAINKTACIEGFHTINQNGELNKNIIEEKLSVYENLFIQKLKKVINTRCINKKDKYALSKMMLMLIYRSPRFVKNYKMFFKKSIEAIAELNFRANNTNLNTSFRDHFKIIVYNNCYIKKFIECFNDRNKIKRFYMMNFSLLEAPVNEYFLCSDFPVSCYCLNIKDSVIKNNIFFPLNKNYGLLCTENSLPAYIKLTKEEINDFNINTIIFADEYIYSSVKNNSIRLMIEITKNYS